jgi:glycosyltransferase involved in cell wall biosynthesis
MLAAIDRVGRLAGFHSVAYRLARRVGRALVTAPPTIAVFEPVCTRPGASSTGLRVLLVSHDLSRSGAPRIVVEIARQLGRRGDQITVLAGEDGPRRDELLADGITVIVDPAITLPDAPLPAALAGAFDVALCNTIATHACAATLSARVPTIVYTHETTLIEELLTSSLTIRTTLAGISELWAGSELSATLVRSIRDDVVVMPYGLVPVSDAVAERPPTGSRDPAVMVVLGSFEPRKGQDLVAEAVAMLDPAVRSRLRVAMYGRILEPAFHAALTERVATLPEVSLHDQLDAADYHAVLLSADAVLVPSRSDTLPLVSLDALGAARLLLCTPSTGTSRYIDPGVSGFVAGAADVGSLAAMLSDAMSRRDHWPTIAAAGQRVFDRRFSADAFAEAVATRIDAVMQVKTPA